MKTKEILVTGGAGYIGSHAIVALCDAGYTPVVVDNFINSTSKALIRLESIVGKSIHYYELDIRDEEKLNDVFSRHNFSSVMHFSGLKAVGESVERPLEYYDNNVGGTFSLLKVMNNHDVRKLVFSSSATVYGDPEEVPIKEDAKRFATNPYGKTKLIIEDLFFDLARNQKSLSDKNWQIALLRYFNPIGAHPTGFIGEDPKGIPNNLMPFILKVAIGELAELKVFGADYATEDGTGKRDYIHVMDLAEGHVAALDWIFKQNDCDNICEAFNLGTGKSTSVLDLLSSFVKHTGVKVAYSIAERRSGDIAECYADPSLARDSLNWKTKRSLKEMIEDGWKWQQANPSGFK